MHRCKKRWKYWSASFYRAFVSTFGILFIASLLAELWIVPAIVIALTYHGEFPNWSDIDWSQAMFMGSVYSYFYLFIPGVISSGTTIIRWLACPHEPYLEAKKRSFKDIPAAIGMFIFILKLINFNVTTCMQKKMIYWYRDFAFSGVEVFFYIILAFSSYFKFLVPAINWQETDKWETYHWHQIPWQEIMGREYPIIFIPIILGAIVITSIRWRRRHNGKTRG